MKPSHFFTCFPCKPLPREEIKFNSSVAAPGASRWPLVGLDPPVLSLHVVAVAVLGHPHLSPPHFPRTELMLQPRDGAGSKVSVPRHHLHAILGKNSTLQGWPTLDQAAQRSGGIAVPGNAPKGCGCGAWGQGIVKGLAVLG